VTEEGDPFWEDPSRGLTIRLARTVPPAAVALLERTVWGGRRMRYRIRDLGHKLARFTDPHALTLEAGGELAAVCVVNRRRARLGGRPLDTFHFAMIATDPAHWDKDFAGLLAREAARLCRETLGERGAAYAYIEEGTEYSLRISQSLGRSYESALPLTVFSRLAPRPDPAAGPLREADAAEVIDRLGRLYDGHLFPDFADSVIRSEYEVLNENGRIAAGAQAEPLRWSIESMPGIAGWAVLRLLPLLPLFRRWLDPADLHFLRFGNLLCEAGREGALIRLMESMLARHRVPLGLVMLDARSPVYRRLRSHGRLGLLQHAVSGKAKVVADFQGLTADEIAGLQTMPMLMSPLDVF